MIIKRKCHTCIVIKVVYMSLPNIICIFCRMIRIYKNALANNKKDICEAAMVMTNLVYQESSCGVYHLYYLLTTSNSVTRTTFHATCCDFPSLNQETNPDRGRFLIQTDKNFEKYNTDGGLPGKQ